MAETPQVETITKGIDVRLVSYVKQAFVTALRQAFSHPSVPVQYRYNNSSQGASQIAIYRGRPKRVIKYPAVMVETGDIDVSISSLNAEEAYEIDDDTGLETARMFTGKMVVPVEISIDAESVTDRDNVTELVAFYIRFVFRDLFFKNNLPYVGISARANERDFVDGKEIFRGSVRVICPTEFKQSVDLSLLESINSISMEMLFGLTQNDLQPND